MIVLKIAGIVLVCIIGLLLLPILLIFVISIFKTRLYITFSPGKKEVSIRHLFIKLKIYPFKKRKQREEPKKKEKKPAPSKEKDDSEQKPSGIAAFFKKKLGKLVFSDYINMLTMFRDGFIKKILFERLYLKINVGSGSADTTAQRYGQLTAIIFPILGRLNAAGNLKDADVSVYPDFNSENISVKADVIISMRFFNMFVWALKAARIILS